MKEVGGGKETVKHYDGQPCKHASPTEFPETRSEPRTLISHFNGDRKALQRSHYRDPLHLVVVAGLVGKCFRLDETLSYGGAGVGRRKPEYPKKTHPTAGSANRCDLERKSRDEIRSQEPELLRAMLTRECLINHTGAQSPCRVSSVVACFLSPWSMASRLHLRTLLSHSLSHS